MQNLQSLLQTERGQQPARHNRFRSVGLKKHEPSMTDLRFEMRSGDLTTNGSFGALNAKTGNGRSESLGTPTATAATRLMCDCCRVADVRLSGSVTWYFCVQGGKLASTTARG